jgi:hypothetical protein
VLDGEILPRLWRWRHRLPAIGALHAREDMPGVLCNAATPARTDKNEVVPDELIWVLKRTRRRQGGLLVRPDLMGQVKHLVI